MAEPFRFTLNGQAVAVDADPKTSTLEVLREQLGVHTCKAGCSPQGLCGCCTALIEGKPRLTCTLPIKSAAGKSITTMDGLPPEDRSLLAESFVRAGGTQCGYCTPGIVLSSWALLQGNATPSHDEITRALNQHLCRCTGYTAIYAAIERAAAVRRGEADPLTARPRPEGHEVTLGDRPYVDDLDRPGMLYGGVVLAPVAAGTIEAVDVEAARALPGVVAVRVRVAPGERVGHAGDVVVSIAATSPGAVRAAQAAVVVKVTPGNIDTGGTDAPGEEVARLHRREGDVEAALQAAALRVTLRHTVAASDPVYLEPEAALAVPVGEGLHVYSAGHDATAESVALTSTLRTPVRVFLVPSGGSYGGKEGLVAPLIAAELAVETGLPVRLAVGLEAGMRLHPRRPAGVAELELGCDAEGRVTALRASLTMDGGVACLAPDHLVAQAIGSLVYDVPNVDLVARVVRTTHPSAGPIRGGGAVALCFAVEQAMADLARQRGEDGFGFRRRNVSTDTAAVMDALAEHIGATSPGAASPGIALGRADGSGGARVVLTVTGPDEVEVMCNVPELGQGRDEVLARELCRVTGLPGSAFTIVWADSAVVGTGAAATTPVEEAAAAAGQLLVEAGGALAGLVGRRFVGVASERAPGNVAVSVATLGEAGEVTSVVTATGYGERQDPRLVANLVEGASHMGLGVALSEEVEVRDDLPEGRFRFLGVLKPKGCARFEAVPVAMGGRARELSEAAMMSVPAAIAVAVATAEGRARAHLPMKDTAAARAVGVRPPKAPVAAG